MHHILSIGSKLKQMELLQFGSKLIHFQHCREESATFDNLEIIELIEIVEMKLPSRLIQLCLALTIFQK